MKPLELMRRLLSKISRPPEKIRSDNYHKSVLDIILAFSIVAFVIINIIRLVDYFIYNTGRGLPLWITIALLLFFIGLAILSRFGYVKLASILLIALAVKF